MIWLGDGVLKTSDKKRKKKYINQFEEIPSGFISSDRVKQLEKFGLIGDSLPPEIAKEKAKEKAEEKAKEK